MKKIKELETRWQNHLMIIAAFRYCLGRQSYIVSECTHWLCEWWEDIRPQTKKIILGEIKEALEKGTAGDVCDQETWRSFLEYVTKGATPQSATPTAYLSYNEK